MAPFKVIIIGGGLAGSCLANGLANNASSNVTVSIHERHAQHEQRGGYLIRLGSFALTGFRACLNEERFQAVVQAFGRSGGVIASAPALYDKNFKLLIDMSKFPAYTKSAPVSRSRLRDILQEPLREKGLIKFESKFERFEILDNSVRAHFADGTFEDGDILIAADGSGSRVNKQLGLDNIVDTSETAFGYLGKCDVPRSALAYLPKAMFEKGSLGCQFEGTGFFGALYLPDDIRLMGQPSVEDVADSKLMLDKFDESMSSLMAAASFTNIPGEKHPASGEEAKQYILEQFRLKGLDKGYSQVWEAVDPEQIYLINTRVAKDTPADWRQRARSSAGGEQDRATGHPRVWLIGDAIHPMLPTRGMGANQALCDTAEALPCLLRLAGLKVGKEHSSESDIETELRTYEGSMIPRGIGWVKASNDTNELFTYLTGWRGKIIIFGISTLLNVVGAATSLAHALGWRPKDDAPELP